MDPDCYPISHRRPDDTDDTDDNDKQGGDDADGGHNRDSSSASSTSIADGAVENNNPMLMMGVPTNNNNSNNKNNSPILSREELRQRRLVALNKQHGSEREGNILDEIAAPEITIMNPSTCSTLPSNETTTTTSREDLDNFKNDTKNNFYNHNNLHAKNYDNNNYDDEEDDDDELQQALALSLMDDNATNVPSEFVRTSSSFAKDTHLDRHVQDDRLPVPVQQKASGASSSSCCSTTTTAATTSSSTNLIRWSSYPVSSINEFHQLMWDPLLTTESDQQRWIQQGIDIRSDPSTKGSNQLYSNKENDTWMEDCYGSTPTDSLNTESATGGILEQFAKSHLPWGLVQEHGGPCGVLATVQAELLRILLFSTTEDNTLPVISTTDTNNTKITTSNAAPESSVLFSPETIQSALAGAIAIVLARAALTPSAVERDNDNNNNDNNNSQLGDENKMPTNPPSGYVSSTEVRNDNPCQCCCCRTGTVQIIIPNHPIDEITQSGLEWDDLHPWPVQIPVGVDGNRMEYTSATNHSKLSVYTIHPTGNTNNALNNGENNINNNHNASGTNGCTDCKKNNNLSTTAKRQKTTTTTATPDATDGTISYDSNHQELLDDRIQQLANHVQQFLVTPFSIITSKLNSPVSHTLPQQLPGVEISSENTSSLLSSPSSAELIPLDYFRSHGGVLLLVLSVAQSRGMAIVKEEFDDPIGSRLTSNFGHCAQELINVFLTGQAVSNVFDNNLTPVGMICRGIQSRPNIGYLSQLEAMRYCEVGSFYKSPKYPIWVVGSTSHFTVLFGDRIALKESQSDILLDQCRRAFKSIDVEENGFIVTEQLRAVYQKLDIIIETKTIDIDETKIQTLAAALEVSGAGIILWDDFWKATSRLLTGASFESVVLNTNDDVPAAINVDEDGEDPIMIGSTTNTTVAADDNSSTKRQSSNDSYNHNYNSITDNPPPLLITNGPSEINVVESIVGETDEQMARRLAREWEQESSTTATTITTVTTSASTATTTTPSAVGMNVLTEAVARVASPMDIDPPTSTGASTILSDEELARKLQAEWDSEVSGAGRDPYIGMGGDTSSMTARSGSPPPLSVSSSSQFLYGDAIETTTSQNNKNSHYVPPPSTPPRTIGCNNNMTTVVEEDYDTQTTHNCSLKPAALPLTSTTTTNSAETTKMKSNHHDHQTSNPAPSKALNFEQYGDSFTLYHYNGLRGGVLTPFRITRLSSDEAVGSSIALNKNGSAATGESNVINLAQDLEDVVRTKWPSCVINWLDSALTSID